MDDDRLLRLVNDWIMTSLDEFRASDGVLGVVGLRPVPVGVDTS
jgi:hypothetical protein